jgi:hypothetical protein
MPLLANGGGIVIFVLIMIGVGIFNAIKNAAENQKKQQGGQPQRPTGAGGAARRTATGDEVSNFLAQLAGKAPAKPARPQPVRSPEPPSLPTQPASRKPTVQGSTSRRISRSAPETPVVLTQDDVASSSAALRLGAALPADALKQAIVLREILGPCRAREPRRSGSW